MKRMRTALCLILALVLLGGSFARAESPDAAQYLANGIAYLFGNAEGGYNREAALASFEAAANAGSAEALYYLGVMAEQSAAIGRFQQAMAYYEQAAALGCAKGLYGMGNLYRKGLGVEKNYDQARALYEQAVSLGCAGACVGLGRLYRYGEGVEADGIKALNYYAMARCSQRSPLRSSARPAWRWTTIWR